MAKARGLEAKLKRVQALREAPVEVALSELRQALADPSNFVAAAAAEIAGVRMMSELAPDLAAAFERFLVEPAETDKLCRAKTAIIEALQRLEYDREEVFRCGVFYVQQEGAWGKPVDTAVHVRANSAFALARLRVPDLLNLLVDLLLDEEAAVRRAAAQALGASGRTAAMPLLRFKARSGDLDPTVTGECLTALMSLDPDDALPFVAGFLRTGEDAVREGAAFALGESRRPEALQHLLDCWPYARGDSLQDALLLAISMTRLPAGLDFLLALLAEDQATAQAALTALRIHRHNDTLRERIAAAVSRTGNTTLLAKFQQKFET